MKIPFKVDLTGKTAIVTGGSGTLCSAMAYGLAVSGAKVAIIGRNKDKLNNVTDELINNAKTEYSKDIVVKGYSCNVIDNEELNGDFVESNVRPYGGTAGNRHGYTSTETVFWNTKGNYYKSGMNYIIDSRQFGNGYIIGTQGAATNVKTTPTTMSSQYGTVNTAPEDYKEGIGKGATLYPQSLYYDQLEKRLSKSSGGETVTETAKKIPGKMQVLHQE